MTKFIPTHRHADGGLYRFVRLSEYKAKEGESWSTAIIYENEQGSMFVTSNERWLSRFTPLNGRDYYERQERFHPEGST